MNFGLPNACPSCRRDISLLAPDGATVCPFCGDEVWHIKMGGKSWYYSSQFADNLFRSRQTLLPDFGGVLDIKDRLLASGLIAAEQLSDDTQSPGDLVRRFVEAGVLTYWQCWQIYNRNDCSFVADGYKFLDVLQEEPSEIDLCADESGKCILKFPSALGDRGLYRELSVVRRVNSAAIVPCHGTTMVKGRICLVREYVEGATLAEITVPIEIAAHAISEAARALHALHEEGFCHRCVKPQKLLLQHDGRVRLLASGRCEPMSGSRGEKSAKMDSYNLLRILGCLLGHSRKGDFLPSYTRLFPCFNVGLTRFGTESSLIDLCEDCIADFQDLSAMVVAEKLSAWIADYEPLYPA